MSVSFLRLNKMIKLLEKMFNKELVYYYDERTEKEYEHQATIIGFNNELDYVYFINPNAKDENRTLSYYLEFKTILHKQEDLDAPGVFSAYIGGLVAVGGVNKEFKDLQKIFFSKKGDALLKKKDDLLDKIKGIDKDIEDHVATVHMCEVYRDAK